MVSETFGQRLKRLRDARKLSQADLGRLVWPKRTKYLHQQIAAYESDRRRPSTANVVAIARALDVTVAYLKSGRGTKNLEQTLDALVGLDEVKA